MGHNDKQGSSLILDKNGKHFNFPQDEIAQSGQKTLTDFDSVSISQVLFGGQQKARSRREIYEIYINMMGDPIINQALNLHITQSLGGHETTSEVLFIEAKPEATNNERKMVEQIRDDLSELLNNDIYQVALWAATFGDAYTRIYCKEKQGVVRLETSDFFMPAFIQPFEIGGKTVGYQINIDQKIESLTPLQLARFDMPRMGFSPQYRMQYNYQIQSILEDDLDKHHPIPANVSGSFLEAAERPFYDLQAAILGLNSGRILDSLRESIMALNMANMTKEQQDKALNGILSLLKSGKKRAEEAIKSNKPMMEKITHVIPTYDEKQLYTIDAGGSLNSNTNSYTVDDVMFHAKRLAGALGIDLSMLGFAELLSGGLGDGGFFRVSAQAGQRAILIRRGAAGWVNHIIDVHCQMKYGGIFEDAHRPYEVVFVGATSALERENQETRERKIGASVSLLQILAMQKEQGFDAETSAQFLKEQCGLDEEDAKVYAKSVEAKDAQETEQ